MSGVVVSKNATTTKESLAVGNAARLREACANIAEYAKTAACHTEDAHLLGYLDQIERWAQSALSKPPRNCDVGTAEEQAERKMEFCYKQGGCSNCSFSKSATLTQCALAWAQMPYEEGGVK